MRLGLPQNQPEPQAFDRGGVEQQLSLFLLSAATLALDESWKSSRWPQRVIEQIMEYNILDFSAWKDDRKFGDMFRRLVDGLELFYKR